MQEAYSQVCRTHLLIYKNSFHDVYAINDLKTSDYFSSFVILPLIYLLKSSLKYDAIFLYGLNRIP
ncbi:hypothetical protein MHYMCMPSP_01186 [Hyalomma marginatum]|uniref:Uncharacterized protein n=1 Tax=Hyalomma marginatum TaxID=34627 RepID=A0A8S4BVM4_9ACAR|nr:hypothetical protein MHYMCMPASI_00184 [Hyalomma marginatum]CAG7599192.1 hypothetical protein MHYMCMPSP_01186 [Hyalomma marginatum]